MQSPHPKDALLAQARSDLDRWSRGDTEGYGQSAATDVTYFHNVPAGARVDGIQAFQEFLSGLKGLIPPHEYKLIDPKVQLYGSVGILTLQYHAISPDGELLAKGRGTSVYYETGGAWEMVHTHWSVFDEGSAESV
ncbi:MAG: nuclear transport factor 2 family protein [Gemmatimonadota bacterium]